MSMFRDFTKKVFGGIKKLFTPNSAHKVALSDTKMRKGTRRATPSSQVKINIGFAKMEAFIARGMKLNPMRKEVKKDRRNVKLYPNHRPAYKFRGSLR